MELIDKNELPNCVVPVGENEYEIGFDDGKECIIDEINDAPVIEAIPISVIKRGIDGCFAAIQCDQGGSYEYKLMNALKTVLDWYGTPNYRKTEKIAMEK